MYNANTNTTIRLCWVTVARMLDAYPLEELFLFWSISWAFLW